jgi:hypothetical protein
MDIVETYLDKDHLFYDYGTKRFDGIHPFDESKVGVSFYDQFFTNPDYMRDVKNLRYEIDYITPKEYFEECAKFFNTSLDRQLDQIKVQTDVLDHLRQVLYVYKRTFPIGYLNYTTNQQEGRHRWYAVGSLLGWNKKFPVMKVYWADEDRAQEEKYFQEEQAFSLFKETVDSFVKRHKDDGYTNIDDVLWDLNTYLDNEYDNAGAELVSSQDVIRSKWKNFEYDIPVYKFDIEIPLQSDIELDLDDLDLDDLENDVLRESYTKVNDKVLVLYDDSKTDPDLLKELLTCLQTFKTRIPCKRDNCGPINWRCYDHLVECGFDPSSIKMVRGSFKVDTLNYVDTRDLYDSEKKEYKRLYPVHSKDNLISFIKGYLNEDEFYNVPHYWLTFNDDIIIDAAYKMFKPYVVNKPISEENYIPN